MFRKVLPELHQLLFEDLLRHALLEDLGRAGDVTSDAVVEHDRQARARIIAREACRVSGGPVAAMAFHLLDPNAVVMHHTADCDDAQAGDALIEVHGRARSLLSAERTAINLLARMSGIATLTRTFVEEVAQWPARVICTRKTTPGLRALEKYAVRCGGGSNHRFGLDDSVIIKDNHIALAGGVRPAVERVRLAIGHTVKVELEVDTLEQLEEGLEVGVDVVMLDNMSVEELRQAMELANGKAVIEASGGITLENAAAVASTGVDLMAVGALTHSAKSVDLSMEVMI
ncbi:MAG: carboxylating nicotinate-nucleotide diphosphorylase [Thermoanaerobaculales bacterium]|jgi:nicotinate-nucleotide pyrophosphorylase (carboxylating)|nr:carboxylating nicotinate-nucleotide diphosphorylase [Thermoanaerobaculales bacterium]